MNADQIGAELGEFGQYKGMNAAPYRGQNHHSRNESKPAKTRSAPSAVCDWWPSGM